MSNQKSLVSKLQEASKLIEGSNRQGKASYIQLSEDYIKKLAQEQNVSFDDMVKIIEEELKFKP